jgi:predicted Fe-Mo cluster-binding NifX family protein
MDRVAISVLRDFEGLCASMDERFGRARAFLVVDRRTGKTIETIENVPADVSHGAGTAAASLLRSAGVEAIVSGRFGPNSLDVLRALGIEAWLAPPGINAGLALLMLEGGSLERMESLARRSESLGQRVVPAGDFRTSRMEAIPTAELEKLKELPSEYS